MLFFLKDVFPILLYDFVKPIKNGKFAKYEFGQVAAWTFGFGTCHETKRK